MKGSVFGRVRFNKFPVLFSVFALFILLLLVVFLLGFKREVRGEETAFNTFQNKDYQGFEDYARSIGSQRAYDLVKAYFQKNEPEAHDFAHVIGFVAVNDGDLEGLKVCDTLYNYGCMHGFMQVYLRQHGLSSVQDMEAACASRGEVHAPSCLHGIGHGLMMISAYDLFGALDNCQVLENAYQTYCFDGVFMERIAGSMLSDSEKLKITEDELFSPCDRIDHKYKRECIRNQVSVWFSFFRQDTTKVGTYCAAVEGDYWQICFESIGLINVQSFGEDFQKLIPACSIVNEVAHDHCLIGVMKELLFEGKSPQVALEVCNQVTAVMRQNCFEIYSRMNLENRQRFG